MDWSIQEIARLSGTTSRTLRHYGDVGLLKATRIGSNGYRYYDQLALARLQRILMLRQLGLGLAEIAKVIDGKHDDLVALDGHLGLLRQEKERLDRQIASVETTLRTLREGKELMAEDMLDGFAHTQFRDEVVERWGADAYARGDRWWRELSAERRESFHAEQSRIQADYLAAFASGATADSALSQEITARHFAWITTSWQGRQPTADQFTGLGDLYVADDRFGSQYGGPEGAAYVRTAMATFAQANLEN